MSTRPPKRPDHKPWTEADDRTLAALYPHASNEAVGRAMGRSTLAIRSRGAKLGLHKSDAYKAEFGGRFKPGHTTWNTGMKGWQAGGRSAETRFKPGHMGGAAQHNYKPIGSLRISKDGHLERKVTDAHPVPARRWVGVHRLVWEAAHGPVPSGHVVRFKPGQHTTDPDQITLDRLECISQRENMLRNSSWVKYPPEIARLVQLKGAITRQANRINKEATT